MNDTMFLVFVLLCFVLMVLVALSAIRAAYCNGICDGYGYAKEPWNRGYHDAGYYLRENMSHRWPELDREPD